MSPSSQRIPRKTEGETKDTCLALKPGRGGLPPGGAMPRVAFRWIEEGSWMDRWIRGVIGAGALGALRVAEAAAQDTVSSGNGGVATASANGGAVSTGDI